MLVLSRKPGERILVGDQIVVTVVRIGGGAVRIGIEAPKEYPVIREELDLSKISQSIDGLSSGIENDQSRKVS